MTVDSHSWTMVSMDDGTASLAALKRLQAKYTDCVLLAKNGERVPATRALLAACSPELERRLDSVAAGGTLSLPELQNGEQAEELVAFAAGGEMRNPDRAVEAARAFHITTLEAQAVRLGGRAAPSKDREDEDSTGNSANGSAKTTTSGGRGTRSHGPSERSASSDVGGGRSAAEQGRSSSSSLGSVAAAIPTFFAKLNSYFSGAQPGGPGGPDSSRSDDHSRSSSLGARRSAAPSTDGAGPTDSSVLSSVHTNSEQDHTDHPFYAPRPRALVLRYWAWQLVAFLIGVSCWCEAWDYNLERGGLFMDDVMIKRNLNVVDPVFDWDRLIRTDYWGLEMFDPQVGGRGRGWTTIRDLMFEGGTSSRESIFLHGMIPRRSSPAQVWTHKSFRPITVYSFRFDYQNFGFDSSAFHRHNIVLHALSSLLLGYLGFHVLRFTPFFSALLSYYMLTHPVHTESMLYIVGRGDPQCVALMIPGLLVYFRIFQFKPVFAEEELEESAGAGDEKKRHKENAKKKILRPPPRPPKFFPGFLCSI